MKTSTFTADKDYYSDVDPLPEGATGSAYDEGDPRGNYFLVAKGNTISAELAARFGLPHEEKEEKPEPKPEEKPKAKTTRKKS